jgi:hypothetical protein
MILTIHGSIGKEKKREFPRKKEVAAEAGLSVHDENRA